MHTTPHDSMFVSRLPADRFRLRIQLDLAECQLLWSPPFAKNTTNRTGTAKVSGYANTCLVMLSFSAILNFYLLVLTLPLTAQQLALRLVSQHVILL